MTDSQGEARKVESRESRVKSQQRPLADRFLLALGSGLSSLELSLRACLLLGLFLGAAGCDKPTNSGNAATPPPSSKSTKSDDTAPPKAEPKPYLEDWQKPAAALLLTGDVQGYMEPCGCSLKQSGGFARRLTLLTELKEQKQWPVVSLDVGGTAKKTNRQAVIKFEAMLNGMQKLDYAALGLGAPELLFGADDVIAQYVDTPDAVTFLSANVSFFDTPDLGRRSWKLVEVGDVKIGVTSVLGLSHKAEVSPEGVENNITVQDPKIVLPEVIAEMQAQRPNFLLLLSHGTTDEAQKLAEAFPEFRIILTAGGPDEASGKPTVVGDTWIIETGTKGRSVGVLGYYPKKAKQPFRFELVELDSERFQGDKRMNAVMRDYQRRLKDEKLAMSDKERLQHPSGFTFVGADACGKCHQQAYDHWKTTGHFKGFESLLHGRGEDDWVPRQFDPECLSCHVTGWEPQLFKRYESGYLSEEASAHLLGQQCENCHGPGSQHTEVEQAFAANKKAVSDEELEKFREAVRVSTENLENKVCRQCHDAENSPDFNFERDWPKVEHPWRD